MEDLHIWAQFKPYLRRSDCGGVTGSDTMGMLDWKWPEVTGSGPVRKYIMRMHNRKLCNIRPSGAFFTEIDKFTWPEEALSGLPFCFRTFPRTFFLSTFSIVLFSRTFFTVLVFPYFFPVLFPRIFFPYFFHALSSRTFSKVATFEIQRFKISVSCFSSTCRYNTVHVPCEYPFKCHP